MKRRHLGTWHVFCDVAGRVTRSVQDPILTIGAVAIPPETLRSVRGRARDLPGKWKVGRLPGLEMATRALVDHSLPVLAKVVHRANPEAWESFWEFGRKELRKLEAVIGKPLPYLQPGTLLQTWLLLQGTGALMGEVLKRRLEVAPDEIVVREGQQFGVSFFVVNDSDLQDAEARRLCSEYVDGWARSPVTFLRELFGVEPEVTVSFETESREPLLLLADYIAGAFHHADPGARLIEPVAPPEEVRAHLDRFRVRHGRRLVEQRVDFDWEHPLR